MKFIRRFTNRKPLLLAAKNGDIDTVRRLIEEKTFVEVTDDHRSSVLMYIARIGNADVVRDLILKGGALVFQPNENGSTALIFAIAQGHFDTVKLLVEFGADVNEMVTKADLSPLMIASMQGYANIVEYLLQNEEENVAEVNSANKYGRTALMYATAGGHVAVIEALIASGADLNAVDIYGNTPLTIAKHEKNEELYKLLEKAGAKNSADVIKQKQEIYIAKSRVLYAPCITCGKSWPNMSDTKRQSGLSGSWEIVPLSALEFGYGLTCGDCGISFCPEHLGGISCPFCGRIMEYL